MRFAELESEVRGLREKAAAGEPPRAEERDAVPRVSREEADRERHQKREDAIASHAAYFNTSDFNSFYLLLNKPVAPGNNNTFFGYYWAY
jgi:hypothetical protein